MYLIQHMLIIICDQWYKIKSIIIKVSHFFVLQNYTYYDITNNSSLIPHQFFTFRDKGGSRPLISSC